MKLILEFDDSERYEHEVACKALDVLILLDALDSELRSALKHHCGEFANLDVESMESVRTWLWAERNSRNIPELK